MRDGLIGSLLAFVGTLQMLGSARGQAIDWLADEAGIVMTRGPGSPRLGGMGGIQIAIPDEGNELNLSDYGRNLSGLLWDSDGRRSEFWLRSIEWTDDLYDPDGERVRTRDGLFEAGGQLTWRMQGRRLLGVDYSFDDLDRSVERGDEGRIRGPWWGAFVGQSIGRFTVSGALHFTADNQDLQTEDVFAIRHYSSGVRYTGAVAYRTGSLTVGLQGQHQVNTIKGVSRDESRFHEDDLNWARPVETYDGTVLWNPSPRLRGAIRARSVRIDGRQDAGISWSDRMPDNPGRENFRTEVGTFDEAGTGYDIGSRWEVSPFGRWYVAAEGEVGGKKCDVEEGSNFKGSRRAEQSKDRLARAVLGSSYPLFDEELRIGLEGGFLRSIHEESDREGTQEVTSREWVLRTGIEWFANERIALRGGFLRIARDSDVDAPRTLSIGNGFTVGGGYFPRGGLFQIDAEMRFEDLDPDYEGNPRRGQSRFSFSFGARFLL